MKFAKKEVKKEKFGKKPKKEEAKIPTPVRKTARCRVIESTYKKAEETLRGLGEVVINDTWKIVRSDKLNWTVWKYSHEEEKHNTGKVSRIGWKKQRGFYADFPTAITATLKMMGTAKVNQKAVIKLKDVLSAVIDAEKNILKALKKSLTK